MAQKDEIFASGEDEQEEFVPALFARSQREAEAYCELFNDYGIPTSIGNENDVDELDEEAVDKMIYNTGITHGVLVMVPVTMLDDARDAVDQNDEMIDFNDEDDVTDEDDDDLDFMTLDEDREGETLVDDVDDLQDDMELSGEDEDF